MAPLQFGEMEIPNRKLAEAWGAVPIPVPFATPVSGAIAGTGIETEDEIGSDEGVAGLSSELPAVARTLETELLRASTPHAESASTPQPEAEAETKYEAEAEAEVETEYETESEAEAEAEAEAESEAEAEAEAEAVIPGSRAAV